MYVRDTWTYLRCRMIYCAVEMIGGIGGGGRDNLGIGGVVVRGVPLTITPPLGLQRLDAMLWKDIPLKSAVQICCRVAGLQQ